LNNRGQGPISKSNKLLIILLLITLNLVPQISMAQVDIDKPPRIILAQKLKIFFIPSISNSGKSQSDEIHLKPSDVFPFGTGFPIKNKDIILDKADFRNIFSKHSSESVLMAGSAMKENKITFKDIVVSRSFWIIYTGFIVVVVGIDLILEEKAEFYNAAATLHQLGHVISFGLIPETKWQYIGGQEKLGKWALPIATGITFGVPFAISYLIETIRR
jgi:hypothetical protein